MQNRKNKRNKKNKQNKLRVTLSLLLGICTFNAFADAYPDLQQNSGSNNIAYTASSKWYVGLGTGYNLNDYSNSMTWQLFTGYRFNPNFALEANFNRLNSFKYNNNNARVYNLSLDGILSYPIKITNYYETSLYGEAGYGINYTDYSKNSGYNIEKGAYNLGLGINLDLESNISFRLGYNYYQTYYRDPQVIQKNSNVIGISIYYNF